MARYLNAARNGLIALVFALLAGSPIWAQPIEPLARPGFLKAMGLLSQKNVTITSETINRDVSLPLTFDLPVSDKIKWADNTPSEGPIAAWDLFEVESGGFVESLALSEATIAPGTDAQRLFTMANLLVLESYGALAAQYPDARLIRFGPLMHEAGAAVEMIGTLSSEAGPIFFRHVGILPDDTEQALVAIASVQVQRMPVRGEATIRDTHTALAIESLRFLPKETAEIEVQPVTE